MLIKLFQLLNSFNFLLSKGILIIVQKTIGQPNVDNRS